jgi:dolichyl-phosphate beta-glucosyltransferase
MAPVLAAGVRLKDHPRTSIVLPAYNEAKRIGPAFDELFGYLHGGGPISAGGRSSAELGTCEVILVDDGSTDDTVKIVESRPEMAGGAIPLRVIRSRHVGKGGAVRAGMLAARGEFIAFSDADLATPPDQLPVLTAALGDHDIALGSRIHPDGSDQRASQPFYRRTLGRVFHGLAAAWVTGPVPDTQCGFKGFRASVARDLFGRQRIEGIVFDAEIIHLARRRGYTMAVVPVQWSDKRGSRMHVRPRLAWQVMSDLVRIPLLHRGVRPAVKKGAQPAEAG